MSPSDHRPPAPKLRLEHVSLKYAAVPFQSGPQDVAAVDDISLSVYPGEFLVLFGPSGCGKSTLLNLIAGFFKPQQGRILLNDIPVQRPGPDRLMMFQEHSLFPWLNVIDNVSFGLRAKYPWSPRKRRKIARSFIKMVHLDGFEKTLVHQLSGGMKHRTALARALAPDPEVLLIDEPFPSLDALTRSHLYQGIQEIAQTTKKTIVSVTHDPREAACLGDRVIVFSPRPARIVAEISINLPRPRDIQDPALNSYTEQIIRCLREGDPASMRGADDE